MLVRVAHSNTKTPTRVSASVPVAPNTAHRAHRRAPPSRRAITQRVVTPTAMVAPANHNAPAQHIAVAALNTIAHLDTQRINPTVKPRHRSAQSVSPLVNTWAPPMAQPPRVARQTHTKPPTP